MQRLETGVVEKGVWINVGVQTARLPFGKKNFCSGDKKCLYLANKKTKPTGLTEVSGTVGVKMLQR
jgi:hypothetical protein